VPLKYVEPPEAVFVDSGADTLLGALYRPTENGGQPHPTLVLLPGMPGTHLDSSFLGYGLAAAGWNVLTIHYRGTWGSGGVASAARLMEDTASAVEFVSRDPGVDSDRLAIGGSSFGGWLAGRYAAQDDRLLAVVLIAPLVSPSGLKGPPHVDPAMFASWSQRGRAMLGGSETAFQLFRQDYADQPSLLDVAKGLRNRRVLIVTGDRDGNIPAQDTKALIGAIETAKWIREPDADHAFSKHRQWLTQTVVDWLATVTPR